MPWAKPVILNGPHARLEPLSRAHRDALAEAVTDGALWRLWFTSVPRPEALEAEIERRLEEQAQGTMLPFTVRDAAGTIVGMTAFTHIDAANRHVEIGFTWYRAATQRTAVNTQCKLLMLAHAFDTLDCIAVEFRTHFFNAASRRAIERLGAKLDGVLRSHRILADGTLRDTCVYSIVAAEWPTVRTHLRHRLGETEALPQ